MDTQLIIIGAIVLLVIMGVVAFVIRRSESNNVSTSQESLPDWQSDLAKTRTPKISSGLTSEVMNQITAEIRAGRKIEAIKLFREAAGVGLKKAKDVIDGMEKNVIPSDPDQMMTWLESQAQGLATERPSTVHISRDTMSEVLNQIRSGNKINAIKLYRETTGLGLKEAKDAVEGLEKAINAGIPIESFITSPTPATPPQGNWMKEVMDEIHAGRKINAIKIYRENSGLGLKEAKDAVDALEAQLRHRS